MTIPEGIALTAVGVLVAVDIWLAFDPKHETFSNLITRISLKRPMVPFTIGLLVGHWLWR